MVHVLMIEAAEMVERCRDLRLDTQRLTIRRFVASDLELALAHESNREIMKYIRDSKPEKELREKVEAFAGEWKGEENEWLGLPVTPRGEHPMMGIVCFRIASFENETAEIGYRFHQDYHGKGFAFEATRRLFNFLFDDFRARKLTALCTAENEPSYRLMEKLGMRREGRLREHSTLGGRWHDELVYGLLSTER